MDFDGNFTYLLAGYEGSAHNTKVLNKAMEKKKSLPVPDGCYYLGDAGYSNRTYLMVPYCGTRYHLKEWGEVGARPATADELFNLWHSKLQNQVERSFGLMKRRWQVLQKAWEGSIRTQVKLVYALAAIHNFIN